jgi:hypothetical protein
MRQSSVNGPRPIVTMPADIVAAVDQLPNERPIHP